LASVKLLGDKIGTTGEKGSKDILEYVKLI
jgi:hypothetical protein